MSEYRRYRAAGHKLKHSRSGAQDGYARGDCECGWTYTGWTHWRKDVIGSHNRHVEDVLHAKGWRVFVVNKAWEVFAANAKAAAMFRASQRRFSGALADKPEQVDASTWLIDGRRYTVTEPVA